MMRMVFTGPESTAKSSLATWVSNYYKYRLIPEYSRIYLKDKAGCYDQNDIMQMAVRQHCMAFEGRGGAMGQIEDCDLLTYLIWLFYKYGELDQDIYLMWLDNLPSLYLLCAPDILWHADPLREHPDDRKVLFSIYMKFLNSARAPFCIITGQANQRVTRTIFWIESYRKGLFL